ncbi:MAG: hypothetical protein ISR65_19760 [Bacteriovoracaceae bacterium]|nr:hypothetical protein [Bacteriovoracaceae bacterium]
MEDNQDDSVGDMLAGLIITAPIYFLVGFFINSNYCANFKKIEVDIYNKRITMEKSINRAAGVKGDVSWFLAADLDEGDAKQGKSSNVFLRNLYAPIKIWGKTVIMGVIIEKGKNKTLIYTLYNKSLKMFKPLHTKDYKK